MNVVIKFIRTWMLPIAMLFGVLLWLAFHFMPILKPAEEGYISFARNLQPICVGVMLFLQFNVVKPSSMKPHRWFFRLLGLQSSLFIVFSVIAALLPEGLLRLIAESAMLCLICPTAAAAGVITKKIGGNIPEVMTYTILSNCLAALLVPILVPIVNPDADAAFLTSFLAIVRKVFSILVLPCCLAWLVRFLLPKVQRYIERFTDWAFWIWGIALCCAISLTVKAFVDSGANLMTAFFIGAVSLMCCIFQFKAGRTLARDYPYSDYVTAGQVLGQKNTGFLIWLALSFLNPLTSLAGGFYAVWHNIINSIELRKAEEHR